MTTTKTQYRQLTPERIDEITDDNGRVKDEFADVQIHFKDNDELLYPVAISQNSIWYSVDNYVYRIGLDLVYEAHEPNPIK